MKNDDVLQESLSSPVPESLRALADALERALDRATSLVMMRHTADVCTLYLGDPSGPPEDLKQIASMEKRLADDVLRITTSGANRMTIGDQVYRFARSFTQVGDAAAIVFTVR